MSRPPPLPSPYKQPGGHITSHCGSVQRPKPCHGRNPGSMVSPQTMLLVVQGAKDGWSHAWPALPRAQPCSPGPRPPVGAGAGVAAGPLRALLLSARLSQNKQGCIATAALKEPTAPRSRAGARRQSPLPFLWGSLGHWVLPRAQQSCRVTRERPLGPLHGDRSEGACGRLEVGWPPAAIPGFAAVGVWAQFWVRSQAPSGGGGQTGRASGLGSRQSWA